MSAEAELWAMELDKDWPSEERLSFVDKAVLRTLAFHLNDQTGRCDPSHSTLVREININLSSVKRALKFLKGKELITIKHQYDKRTQVYKGVSYIIHYKRHNMGVGSGRPQFRETSVQGEPQKKYLVLKKYLIPHALAHAV